MTWIILAGIAVLIAVPYLADLRRLPMDQSARTSAPGDFAQLSHGVTHFQWHGPADGPVAVCVHGLTTPSFVWGPIIEGLTAMGYRVLSYDLYGRGYSDRPRGDQDADFFIAQLEELLDNQNVDDDITMLGYSMGGAITTAYAARNPQRLRQAVLLAPAGLGHDLGPIAQLVANHRRLGSWLMMAFYGRSYGQSLEAERDLPTAIPGIVDLQKAELGYRGFRAAVLSSLRGILDREQEEEHRRIHAAGTPVLALWGEADEIIPISGMDKLADLNPGARNHVIKEAGHALAYTHSDQVNEVLKVGLRPQI